jgi:hypothetical protein
MKNDVTIYIPKKELEESGGEGLLHTLQTLVKGKVISSFEDVIAITFDRINYIRIQSYLEFLNIKSVLPEKTKKNQRGYK